MQDICFGPENRGILGIPLAPCRLICHLITQGHQETDWKYVPSRHKYSRLRLAAEPKQEEYLDICATCLASQYIDLEARGTVSLAGSWKIKGNLSQVTVLDADEQSVLQVSFDRSIFSTQTARSVDPLAVLHDWLRSAPCQNMMPRQSE